ncbi:MAG: hypothetical protein V2B20_16640, partial [Pseudomonadota bacterium]
MVKAGVLLGLVTFSDLSPLTYMLSPYLCGSQDDLLFGGAGNDQLFAEEKKDMAILIQEGETGTGTGLRGDLLSGGDGEDLLISGAGNDAILSGAETDVICGLCINMSEIPVT